MRAQHEKSCDNSPHLQRTMDSEASTSTTRCAFHARIICPSIALEAFRLSGNGNPRCIFYLLAPHAANLRHPWRIPWIFVYNKTKTSSQKFTYLPHECACFSTKTNLIFFFEALGTQMPGEHRRASSHKFLDSMAHVKTAINRIISV